MKIEIEESALDSLKAMVQQLQDERDMLLEKLVISKDAMLEASGRSMPAAREVAHAISGARTAIAACTETKKVLA